MRVKLSFLSVVFVFWSASASLCDAQLFRRINSQARTYSSVTPAIGRHWGYPGRIEDHLATAHGQNVAGLSHEQLLELHDAIHEGRPIPSRTISRQVPAMVIPSNPVPIPMPIQKQPDILVVPEPVKPKLKSWAPSV